MNRLQFGPLAMLDQASGKAQVSSTQVNHREGKNPADDLAREGRASGTHTDSAVVPDLLSSLNFCSTVTHHNLFIPMHYEKNYAYPLIVYLHDHYQNESQIQKVVPDIDCRNYAAVSVRSPGKIDTPNAWPQTDDAIEVAHATMTQAIAKAVERLNINRSKVFLVGAGAGATMALRLAFQFPEEIAGVAALNGELPSDGSPFSRLTLARQVPVYWVHFRDSQVFEEDTLCSGVALMHSAGFNLTLRQYPVGDSGCKQVYSDLNNWLMENVTSSNA